MSDPGSKTIKAYGVFNATVEPTNYAYGIPFPGTFILNPGGKVTARFFEDAYQQLKHWLEVVYMTERLHESLKYVTPAEFEGAALAMHSPLLNPA